MASENPIIRRKGRTSVEVSRVNPEDLPPQLRQPGQTPLADPIPTIHLPPAQQPPPQAPAAAAPGASPAPQIIIIQAPQAHAPPPPQPPVQVTTEVHHHHTRTKREPAPSALGLAAVVLGVVALAMTFSPGMGQVALYVGAGGVAFGVLGVASHAFGANVKSGLSLLGIAVSVAAGWMALEHPVIAPSRTTPGGGGGPPAVSPAGGTPVVAPGGRPATPAADPARPIVGDTALLTEARQNLQVAEARLQSMREAVLADPQVAGEYQALVQLRNKIDRDRDELRRTSAIGDPRLVKLNEEWMWANQQVEAARQKLWRLDPRVTQAEDEVKQARALVTARGG